MKMENFLYEKGKAYECRVFGKADSRVAKRHLSNILFAIEDCMLLEELENYQTKEVDQNEYC